MSQFSHDLIIVVLDKLFLGGVAIAFAYYLNHLLERRRSQNAYTQALVLRCSETCAEIVTFMFNHHKMILSVHKMLEKIANKHTAKERLSENDLEAGYRYIEKQDEFESTILKLAVNMPPIVMIAIANYLSESNKLFALI